jgi:hypothetical protein
MQLGDGGVERCKVRAGSSGSEFIALNVIPQMVSYLDHRIFEFIESLAIEDQFLGLDSGSVDVLV